MAPRLLSDVWERWAPAVTYFINQESLPIDDHGDFQNYINGELWKGNSIRLEAPGRQFTIDLIETSADKVDIVAFSVIRIVGGILTGGEVVTELSANYPRASDHVERIRGMETVGINRGGRFQPTCCREDWMKNFRKDVRLPCVIAETSRQKIVKVAKERKIQALKLTQLEQKKESSMTNTEDLGVNGELTRNLAALCKKAATLLASKGERKTIQVNENISTQEAISFMSKTIDHLQHWAPSGLFDQARGDKPSEKAASSKATAKAQGEKIKKMKKNHSDEKERLKSEVELVETDVSLLEMNVRRITEEKEQLEKINADLKEDLELSRSRAEEAEERLKQLTVECSDGATEEELAANSAQVTEIIHNQVSEKGQYSPRSTSNDKTDNKELVVKDENFDEDAFIEELAEELRATATYEDVASKESGKHHRVSQLERELETTKKALKNKTDELASATERHTKEPIEAGGDKEKCRCKDKEAYLESVEEHVEKLRGTMEDVLRHVSTYQGRKRRRTEGPDFEY